MSLCFLGLHETYIILCIVEGCALVPPRQFIRTSGGSWALPGAVFSGLERILGGLGGVLGPLEGVLVSWGRLESFVGRLGRVLGRLGGILGRLGGVLVGNMAPTWLPKRSPNRLKIEPKINQFLNASWDLIFIGFCWILEGKWSQVGTQMASKINANFERWSFEETSFSLGKTMILKVLEVEVGTKNPLKIH